ncbi:hypothetical protein AV656_08285 [Bhargavaea cecembensis]|uniref:Glycosyl transferase family 1 domain-containing protein n=1 Tax=Bhargavaea cecembensis TaxID=394098 RepID=A0A165H640_9BACL|nr:glycosyltransferase [Bhargavaea cecembensis]KZE38888.1 hypothetical protein AV656_08285 [Bhargavaea cecembensis]
MGKVKILLGSYVGSVNAQDINCYEIAKRLNSDIFEVHVLHQKNKVDLGNNVHFHRISNNRLIKNLSKLFKMATLNADIYYLPRIEKIDIIFAKIFGKKRCIVSSVEIQNVYENKKYDDFFNKYIFDYFCISNFLNKLNVKHWNKECQVLYLGSNNSKDDVNFINNGNLKKIAFVGSFEERKKPLDYLKVAKSFPDIEFIMIGSGSLSGEVDQYIKSHNLKNVKTLGRLQNSEVYKELTTCDLLLIVSDKEGLPKVVLEAASVGMPTIYISKNYKVDYIEDGINGFAVQNLNEMMNRINELLSNEDQFKNMRTEAYKLAAKYSWDNVINDYEKYFLDTYNMYIKSSYNSPS